MNDEDDKEDFFPQEILDEMQIKNEESDPDSLRHKAIFAFGSGDYEAIREFLETRPNLNSGVFPKLLFAAATHNSEVDWHITLKRNPKRQGKGKLRSDENRAIRRDYRVFCFLLHEEAYKQGNAQRAIPDAASYFGMSVSAVEKIWDSLRKSDNPVYLSMLDSHKCGDRNTVGIAEAAAFHRPLD